MRATTSAESAGSVGQSVSVAIGAVMASSRFIEEASQPILILILVTPWVAYVTSVVTWLEFGEAPILFMVAFTSFPIFTTARLGIGLGLAAAYFSEGAALSNDGLGAAGKRAAAFNNGDVLWATIITTAGLGLAGLAAIAIIERAALRWHVSQR